MIPAAKLEEEMLEELHEMFDKMSEEHHKCERPDWFHVRIQKCYADTFKWAKTNCTGKFIGDGRIWAFEDENDATAFLLRWA